MDSQQALRASHCIENLRLNVSSSEFGYKVQAMAAHVLLRLNYSVLEINRTGHPDVVATRDMKEFRFEVEAEAVGSRPRQLTNEDFAALAEIPGSFGYFALAISFPTPRWIVVPVERLKARKPSSTVLLDALSDRELSTAWTCEYTNMLNEQCRRILRASFGALCSRALEGRGL